MISTTPLENFDHAQHPSASGRAQVPSRKARRSVAAFLLLLGSLLVGGCDGFEFTDIFDIFSCDCSCICSERQQERLGDPGGAGIVVMCTSQVGFPSCQMACESASQPPQLICAEL